jgi:hypothetical protein
MHGSTGGQHGVAHGVQHELADRDEHKEAGILFFFFFCERKMRMIVPLKRKIIQNSFLFPSLFFLQIFCLAKEHSSDSKN